MEAMNNVKLVTTMQRRSIEQRQTGMSRRESAAACGVSPQAVKKRLSRARKRILGQVPAAQRERYLALLASRAGRKTRVRAMSFSFIQNV